VEKMKTHTLVFMLMLAAGTFLVVIAISLPQKPATLQIVGAWLMGFGGAAGIFTAEETEK
jgi:hypothetical protein